MSNFKMPTIRPVSIQTKNKRPIQQIFTWLFKSRKWEVVGEWELTCENGSKIAIHEGFLFNGASVPRMFWWLLNPTGILFIPALIHDYAYTYHSLWVAQKGSKYFSYQRITRKDADNLFKQLCFQVNGIRLVSQLSWAVLRLTGWLAWFKSSNK